MTTSLPERTMVRVAIADDHPIFREGLKKLLESEPDFSVIGEAADGAAAVALVKHERPDVLLLDLAMPRMGGLEVLTALKPMAGRIIVLTAAISEAALREAVRLGAAGIVLKETATRQLITDIRKVLDGEFIVGSEVLMDMIGALRREEDNPIRRFGLTEREVEIIGAIVEGRSNKDVADFMRISVQTVKHHLTSIFDKTGVSTRLELALFALRHGIAPGK